MAWAKYQCLESTITLFLRQIPPHLALKTMDICHGTIDSMVISQFRRIYFKKIHIHNLVHGHSSWSTFDLHLVRGQKAL